MPDTTYSFLVIDHSPNPRRRFGELEFRVPPRAGEYISLNDEEGIGQAYKVVAVIHPAELAGTCGDLIVQRVGTDAELRGTFNQ